MDVVVDNSESCNCFYLCFIIYASSYDLSESGYGRLMKAGNKQRSGNLGELWSCNVHDKLHLQAGSLYILYTIKLSRFKVIILCLYFLAYW